MKGRLEHNTGDPKVPVLADAALAADLRYRRNSLAALIRVTTRELKEAIHHRRPAAEIEAIRKRRQACIEMMRRLSAVP